MKTIYCTIALLLLLNQISYAQNIGINGSGANAHPSALLDIDASSTPSLGMLVPRIALQAINLSSPVTSPATSLLVYNTATASTGTTAVSPGYYYWDGAKWVRFAYSASGSSANDWNILGNAGTSPATNFLGTTDAQDLVFRTNNTEKMRVLSNGNVGIGVSNPNLAKLEVGGNALFGGSVIGVSDEIVHIASGSGSNSGFTRYGYWNGLINTAIYDVGYKFDGSFMIRNVGSGSESVPNSMYLTPSGNFGIGISNPSAKLHVTDNQNKRTLHVEHNFNGLTNTDAAFIGGFDAGYTSTGLFVLQKDNVSFVSAGTNLINVVSNSVSQMLINGIGNMGIGTTNPTQKLHINEGNLLINNTSLAETALILSNNNTGVNSSSYITFRNQAGNFWNNYLGGPTGYAGVEPNAMEWWEYPFSQSGNSGTCCLTRFRIQPNNTGLGYATVVIDNTGQMYGNGWSQPSDRNLKQNIQPLTNALSKISKLGGYSYQFTKESNLDDGKTHIGVIAQEVEAVLPEAVTQYPQATYKSINYDALIPLQIEAIKELNSQNIEQQQQIETLKQQNDLLIKRLEALEKK